MKSLRALAEEPISPLWRYCLLAVPVALVPTLFIAGLALGVLSLTTLNIASHVPRGSDNSAADFVGYVVFAPMAESFLVAGLVTLLRRSGESFLGAAASSAVIWGLAHALFGALWFFGTVWAFFVFSCAYMAWRKVSFWHGYAAATAPHAAINLLAFAGKALLDGI